MVFIYGTMHKKGVLRWNQRFFVLKGTELKYFERQGDSQPRKTFVIDATSSIEKVSNRGDGFVLVAGGKELRLRADTEKEEKDWFETMDTLIKNEKEKAMRRPMRKNTKLWWAETKHGQFSFELDNCYEMRKTIGSGGYGVVISALNTDTNSKCAIKKVAAAFEDVLVAKRMIREIRLLRQCNHENVIRIVDLLPPPSLHTFEDLYIVMERMDTDLHHIIYSGQNLKAAHVQFFTYQILCALKYIHSAGILHRDLKPANVLVNTTCDLKLCDFGLARSIGSPDDDSDNKLTEYVVTRWWRAPEVFLEAEYGTAVDCWSVGCILGEMLSKKPMFSGNNTAQMLKLIMQFTGKPVEAEVAFIRNKKARDYVLDMAEPLRLNMADRFGDCDAQCLDLLSKLLIFQPNRRLTVDEALKHPWLSSFYTPDQLPLQVAKEIISLDAVERAPLTKASLQRVMLEDVCVFRPECLAELDTAPPDEMPPLSTPRT